MEGSTLRVGRASHSYFNRNAVMEFEQFKNIVGSFLEKEKIPEALHVYTSAYRLDFLKAECIEILVNGVAKIARKNLLKTKKFSFDSFLCSRCHDIIKDPVTLKCGHTFSKKCMLLKSKNDSFTCPNCRKSYSLAYLSQLKNNVTIISLVEMLYEKYLKKFKLRDLAVSCQRTHDKAHGTESYFQCRCDDPLMTAVSPYAESTRNCKYFGDFKEAFKAYLIRFTLNPKCDVAKERAIEVLQEVLRKNLCPSSYNPLNPIENLNRNTLGHSENNHRNSGSSGSLHVADDDLSSSDDEDTFIVSTENSSLQIIFNDFLDCIKKIAGERSILKRMEKRDPCLDKKDFECPLCMRLLWEPVTTTCGHTFCRVCLNRWFDHQPNCPMCKTSLTAFLAERVQNITEFLELAIESLFPKDYAERKTIYNAELDELSKAGRDPEHEIPLFICTVALPTVPCPLHVFEPRYRHMIRQCMESGSRRFGMCGVVDDEIAEYGTMLEIRDVQYFPDGRSIVDTIGRKRFRILRRGERDGYHTGAIEFLKDRPLSDLDRQSIQEKHDRTYKESKIWFTRLPDETKLQILQHFGPMPHVETDYFFSPNGPSWSWWLLAILPVETKLKVLVISLTSLPQRLEMLYRILLHFQSDIVS